MDHEDFFGTVLEDYGILWADFRQIWTSDFVSSFNGPLCGNIGRGIERSKASFSGDVGRSGRSSKRKDGPEGPPDPLPEFDRDPSDQTLQLSKDLV